jgi:hypothetical protein
MQDSHRTTMPLRMATSVAAIALSVAAGASQADAPPAMHWGSLDLQTSVNNCVGRGGKAFYDAGIRNAQKTGWLRYGEKGNANVLVSCTPLQNGGSYLVVSASSTDSKAAELLRNDIRARIARMHEID